jgi:glycosyltransferase involved in cell wall biosynthesis
MREKSESRYNQEVKEIFNPLASIIIPVYNGSNYLKEAIDSALAQTYKNIEVIVVNDGSTDDTDNIARSYGDKIRYFAKENGGVASAMNLGLDKMQGDYFSWLSHDDLYDPQKIEYQVYFLSKHFDKHVILYSDYAEIDNKSKVIRKIKLNHVLLEKKSEYSLLRGWLNGNTVLIPREAFEEYGKFKEELRCTQDYDKWFDMMKTYKFVHVPLCLVKYRIHPMQDTNSNPGVVIEGNAMWIKMMKELPRGVKIRLEGSEYMFYREMALFLKGTVSKKAMEFASEEAKKLLPKKDKFNKYLMNFLGIIKSNVYRDKIIFAIFSPKQFLKKYYKLLVRS